MQADTITAPRVNTPFARYLSEENDVLRSAAVQALLALDDADAVRVALLEARMDPDPDVRGDAMDALVGLARPEDAPDIRHSLMGDPVREVKLACISALARLADAESVDLLRALVTSRAEELIAWEDEGSDWEDWLDIQTAAIRALGLMGAVETIDDLLAALNDPYGQAVDIPVFAALAGMGQKGVAALLDAFRSGKGVVKRRAADALSHTSPDSLAAHLEDLLLSEAPALRQLALRVLDAKDPRCMAMATDDPDPGIRAAALDHAAAVVPGLARACLSDPEDQVKASALRNLLPPFDSDFHEALVDNMLVWLDRAKPVLALEAAAKLAALAPNRAEGPLLKVLDDTERPLEIRVAAVKALGVLPLQLGVPILVERLENPAHQVRAALLTLLRTRADAGDQAAIDAIAAAISGTLGLTQTDPEPEEVQTHDAGTPKEGAGPRRISITPDGEIVELEDPAQAGSRRSTLDSIQSAPGLDPSPRAEDTPEESSAKRAKRRAVEGAGDLGLSVATDAIRICADVSAPSLTDAIVSRCTDADATLRRVAWQALAQRNYAPTPDDQRAEKAFRDPDPMIRLAALHILTKGDATEFLAEALSDEDPLIQAEAVSRLPHLAAVEFVGNGFSAVRQAAVQRVLESGDDNLIDAAVNHALDAERTDALAILANKSPSARTLVVSRLGDGTLSPRKALVALRGLRESLPKN